MRIVPTTIDGVALVEAEPVVDERGAFIRTFGRDEFAAEGLDPEVVQCSVSVNHRAATLRGMHLQRDPYGEGKLVRCTRGAMFDVAVDVRPGSSTFGRWLGWELDAESHRALWLPPGVAHGFVTLSDDTEVSYQISVAYRADAACGFRWDDPTVAISWPVEPVVISDRDRNLPLLADLNTGA